MSPTKWYVLFWIVCMAITWGIGLGFLWEIHKLIGVLTKFLEK